MNRYHLDYIDFVLTHIFFCIPGILDVHSRRMFHENKA